MSIGKVASGGIGKFTIESANNGETIEIRINLATGEVEPAGYVRLRHLMRCLRTGAETPIDPRLIDLLYRIALRTKQKIVLVSGFRAPMFSLATLSYHTRGMAADIRIPGMTPLMARDLAESMGVHGLGYYPVSGFIHVDVRDDKSRWTDFGQEPGRRRQGARAVPQRRRAERRGRRRRRRRTRLAPASRFFDTLAGMIGSVGNVGSGRPRW